jgi:hypothetical protein
VALGSRSSEVVSDGLLATMQHVSSAQFVGDSSLVGTSNMNVATQAMQNLTLSFGNDESLPSAWSIEDVAQWLMRNGFQDLVDTFRSNDIKGAELLRLEADDFYQLGVTKVGVRKRLEDAIAQLRSVCPPRRIGLGWIRSLVLHSDSPLKPLATIHGLQRAWGRVHTRGACLFVVSVHDGRACHKRMGRRLP